MLTTNIRPENPSPKRGITNFKKGTLFYKLRLHFRSYCNHTSIHGFQYFGQDRTIIEKLLWVIIFIAISSCCVFAIYLIYDKWRKSPVIVSLTTKDTPIYLVPFPAVTICPTIKFSSEYIDFERIFKQFISINEGNQDDESDEDEDSEELDLTELEAKLFKYMLPICETSLKFGLHEYVAGNETVSEDIYEYFLKCSPFLNDTKHSGTFMETKLSFYEAFRPVMTEHGLCFTFNMLSTEDLYTDKVYFNPGFRSSEPKSSWIPQLGYSKKSGLQTYPRRALMSGVLHSLEIRMFHWKNDISYLCTGAEQGYKVILHLPTRVARPTLEYTMAPFGKATMISVSPEMMTTSAVVKNYPPDKRDCYFQDEKYLAFFKIYSKTNCQIECLTNYTLKECGCVAFYMPRVASTPICGILKISCVINSRKKYELIKLKSKLDDFNQKQYSAPVPKKVIELRPTHKNSSNSRAKSRSKRSYKNEDLDEEDLRCQCLRPCNDITYTGSATTIDFNWRKSIPHKGPVHQNYSNFDITQITVFLGTNTLFTTERNELYGPTDFLSNFGGLLGLFTGFSILSLMEILYFCSFRILGNLKIFGRWYGDDRETQ